MRILILSGADRVRFPTMLNQKAYAEKHGYRYRFDISPYPNRKNVYYHKLDAISDALQDADWVFWIDDDAAFTQFENSLEEQVPELNDPNLSAIFCASPVNPQGGWTMLSSGNFFVKNSKPGCELIRQARLTELDVVKEWWDPDRLGMFTCGDQDALVFQIITNKLFASAVQILEYQRFNTRPYHFSHADEFFLVHFNVPGIAKEVLVEQFAQRHGLTSFLLSEEEFKRFETYAVAQSRMIKP